jgi:predicted PurR-regulated permease PerM
MSDSQRRALRFLSMGLVVAVGFTVAPYVAPLLLAAWIADLLQPAIRKLERRLGGRRRSAAAIVVLLLAGVLIPFAGVVAAVILGAFELAGQLRGQIEGQIQDKTLGAVLLGGAGADEVPSSWGDLLARHGASAWRALIVVGRTSASALLVGLVFVVALYALTTSGARSYLWVARRSPVSCAVLGRFARAFRETGRGLIVAGGGTALLQGTVATVAYVAIGIPRALLLGPLTAMCALVPIVGTGLVWVPLTIELFATRDYRRGSAILVAGLCVSTVDNIVRPALARFGRLSLPTAVVLVSMLGGISAFGPAGVLLGPLVVRLAVEALSVLREDRSATIRRGPADPSAPPEPAVGAFRRGRCHGS